jgi:hypothetical protein
VKLKSIARSGLILYQSAKRYINDPSLIYSRSNHPDFLIIGAQKSGTSSLFNWLNKHPQMRGSSIKEIHYFNNHIHFGRDINWYCKNFPGKAVFRFEATPAYMYSPHTCESIHRTYPSMKFIVVLRNPVDRAYSAYNHYRSHFAKRGYNVSIQNIPRRDGNRLYELFFRDRDTFPTFRECLDMEMELIDKPEIFEPALLR